MQVCLCLWQICAFKRGCDTVQVAHHAFISKKYTLLLTLNLGCSTKKCRSWFQVFFNWRGQKDKQRIHTVVFFDSVSSKIREKQSCKLSNQPKLTKIKILFKDTTNNKDYCQRNWPQIIFWRHQPNDRNVSKGTKQFEGTTWVIGDTSKIRKE